MSAMSPALPTVEDYLVFSSLAYALAAGQAPAYVGWTVQSSTAPGGEPSYTFKDPNGESWTVIDQVVSDSGVTAFAFANLQTKQIVIAYRGSVSSHDWESEDTQLAVGQRAADFSQAQVFANSIANNSIYASYNIFVTGHSIGGAEAEVVAASLDIGGVTFAAPGVSTLLTSNNRSGSPTAAQNLTNYVLSTDLVGNYASDTNGYPYQPNGSHIGNTIVIPPPEKLPSLETASTEEGIAIVGVSHLLTTYAIALEEAGVISANPLARSQQLPVVPGPLTELYPGVPNASTGSGSKIQNVVSGTDASGNLYQTGKISTTTEDGTFEATITETLLSSGGWKTTLSESESRDPSYQTVDFDQYGNVTSDSVILNGVTIESTLADPADLTFDSSGDLVAVVSSDTPGNEITIISNPDGSISVVRAGDLSIAAQTILKLAAEELAGYEIAITDLTSGSVDLATQIQSGGTAELTSDMSASAVDQDFAFLDTSGLLEVDNPASFSGTISNFVPGDTIDLTGIATVTGASLGANNVLTVLEAGGGTVTVDLDPTQDFTAENFLLTPDGNGGTDIMDQSDAQPITLTGTPDVLLIINADSVTGTISGFMAGDTIDIGGLGSVTGETLTAGNTLIIQTATNYISLQLDTSQNYGDDLFSVESFGSLGSEISIFDGKAVALGSVGPNQDPISLYFSNINDDGEFAVTTLDDQTQESTLSLYSKGFLSPLIQYDPVVTAGTIVDGYDAVSINNSGAIAGNGPKDGFIYYEGSLSDLNITNKAYFTPTVVNGPTGVSVVDVPPMTYVTGMNQSGEVIGLFSYFYKDSFSFIYDQGNMTILSVPGMTLTHASVINNAGEVAGVCFDDSGEEYGFSYLNGKFQTFQILSGSGVVGIDSAGDVAMSNGEIWNNGTTSNLTGVFSRVDGITAGGTVFGIYEELFGHEYRDYGLFSEIGGHYKYYNSNLLLDTSYDINVSDNDRGDMLLEAISYAYAPDEILVYTSSATVACYVAGTRIKLYNGASAVEALPVGQLVSLPDGGCAAVKWLGHRRIDCRRHPRPHDVWPVRISPDAFGPGLPVRDLWLSPEHAVFVEGVLIPIRCLINGVTIAQEERDEVTYYHVELERHDVILAEGLPCESWLDTGNRGMFENAPVADLYPAFARSSAQAWAHDACAPLVESGAVLEAVRARLNERAGIAAELLFAHQSGELRGWIDGATCEIISGWAWQPEHPGHFARLEILAGETVLGEVVAIEQRDDVRDAGRLEILCGGLVTGQGDGRCGFTLRLSQPLSPFVTHTIRVRRVADQAELWNSGRVIIPAAARIEAPALAGFAAALRATMDTTDETDRAALLRFMTNETDRLLSAYARRSVASAGERNSRPLALFIDETLPVPGCDSASQVALDHMRALQTLGYRVAFAAPDAAGDTAPLEALGVTCCLPPAMTSVEDALRRLGADAALVYLHRVATASLYAVLVRHHCPKARLVYSVADLHFVRVARQAALAGSAVLAAESRRLRERELLAARTADRVITHSPAEATILRTHAPGAKVHVVPWSFPAGPSAPPFHERRDVAFIGSYRHAPNVDAARWLVDEIMPLIWRQDPDIECLLVGSHMPDELRNITRKGVVLIGHAPDLADIFGRVRLTVAPLRYGAGIKGKVLQSLAAGIPCVCTPVAAEGLTLPLALRGCVGTTAADLAALILRLHTDEEQNATAAAAGLRLVRDDFSTDRVDQLMRDAIGHAPSPAAQARTFMSAATPASVHHSVATA